MWLGRTLWGLLALDGFLTLGVTLAASLTLLQPPSQRLTEGLARSGLSIEFYAAFVCVSVTLLFLVFFVVSVLIFLRRPDDGFALFVSIFLLAFGTANTDPQFPEFLQFA